MNALALSPPARVLPWSLSWPGLVLAAFFFAAALTPTLIPRSVMTQGVLAGTAAAAGYCVGALLGWVWYYLEIPPLTGQVRRATGWITATLSIGTALYCITQAARWQNSIRVRMDMEPVATTHPIQAFLIALCTATVLLLLGRAFARVIRAFAQRAQYWLPRRLANLLGVIAATLLVWALASDVAFRGVMYVLDASFQKYDAQFEPTRPRPNDAIRTGGPESLIGWKLLGRTGRQYITSGPSASDISQLSQRPALEPLRVYVGLQGGDTPEARAALALAELQRVKAFERANLVIVTPTGTGWVDPAAMNPLEYLLDGDVASVAVQYSYLSSPLSLLVQPEYGADVARSLFTTIYHYWQTLPADQRPRLYLHGLSLGALNSQQSFELFEILRAPIDGALWSGPPFSSRLWRRITHDRNAGSPAWLPVFHDSSLFRFQNQEGPAVAAGTPWGPTRLVYLQYASDPVTFFDYRDFYRRPAWMVGEPGPDVSRDLHWYPVVTMLQLALDMFLAGDTPMGHGHIYAPEDYLDAWSTVVGEHGWDESSYAALRQKLASQGRRDMAIRLDRESGYENRGG